MNKSKLCTLNILLADDGSEHSQAAVELLGDLPLDEQSRIMALRVFTPTDTANVWSLKEALKITEERLRSQGKQVESELVLGHPAEKIIEVAQKHKSSMIVIGARGLRATLGILLGGVVQQVAEHAELPMLVVRTPYDGLKRILVVINRSEESKTMLSCIGDFPIPPEATFDVLYVAPPIPSEKEIVRYWPGGIDVSLSTPLEDIQEEINQRAEKEERTGLKILAEAIEILKEEGIEAKSTLLRGDAATEIIEYAKENQTDLIVCGGRRLSSMKSWLLGGVSRKLLHYAHCSVMVVKNQFVGNEQD